jgi:hypothetical protein
MWLKLRSHKLHHNMAHTRCMQDKQSYMHLRAFTRQRARVPTHTRTHARTHRPIRNTYCSSTATMIRERALILSYMYIASLV